MDERKKILEAILERIPASMNPVDFLYQTLNISKESVYRRIRGEIDFTLKDMMKIASKLSVSIDELLFSSGLKITVDQPIVFHSRSDNSFDPQQTFLELLSEYGKSIDKIKKARHVEIIIAANRLMTITAVHFDHLFKFYYYKWIHQTQHESLNFCLSDVTLSDDIMNLQTKLKSQPPCGNYTCILDHSLLENTIREIRYYYKRKLISENEIHLLQQDLSEFIDIMDNTVTRKPDIEGYENNIYISATPIESTGLYCKNDDEQIINLWMSYGLNIRSNNPGMCDTYRSWLNTLKKYASLISGCNEALQISYINEQRDHIRNITNKEYI